MSGPPFDVRSASARRAAMVLFLLAGSLLAVVRAQGQPAPDITEPAEDGQVVNPSDVHMEAAPFSEAGFNHDCTDWEIWTVSPSARAWFTPCIQGVERLHTHLGDGTFEGTHRGRRELRYDTEYRLRVRFRDQTGLWTPYAERRFRTGPETLLFPMETSGLAATPPPAWTDGTGEAIVLPGGSAPGVLRLRTSHGDALLEIRGEDGAPNTATVYPPQEHHHAIQAEIAAGEAGFALPASALTFTDAGGEDRTVYLPNVRLGAGEFVRYWVARSGATYSASGSGEEPDFSELAQGAPVPWRVAAPGYKVEVFASGFRLPVNIAFVPDPGAGPRDPLFYVTELYGSVKVVLRDGSVLDYATGLLNYTPSGIFPGTGEQGLAGIAVDPATGDLYAGLLHNSAPPHGQNYPRVIRLRSADGGLTAASVETVLDMPGELQGQSHFISTLTIGPDGKLYVQMGDGFNAATALNLDSFRGKVLRLNLDGTAPEDNPFFDAADGISARDYVYAYGFRNPFGGQWRFTDHRLYVVENGPGSNDRLSRVEPGLSYGWNGTDQSLTTRALYNWTPPHAPVNIAFPEPERFGGSKMPPEVFGHAFVTESGPTWATGPQALGKRIVRFAMDAAGRVTDDPHTVVEYEGSGKASASAIAAGPDGLYFADLYRDQGYTGPTDAGANIFRLSFAGTADFSAEDAIGRAPLEVRFTDRSNVPGPSAWAWDFGDGGTSTEQNPVHTYTTEGEYTVRLRVTGENGAAVTQKNGYVYVGDGAVGLRGEYYANITLSGTPVTRVDGTVNFDWDDGRPMPSLGVDNFSVRWTGQLHPAVSGIYSFHTQTDDGVRLWVNDESLIDRWVDQGTTEHTGRLQLEAGRQYNVRMEYYERGGGAVARLLWTQPGRPKEVIGTGYLYPLAGEAVPPPPPLVRGLSVNVPNPFRHETHVRFTAPGPATLVLYNLLGQEVRRLFDGPASPDQEYSVRIEGAGLPAGVYFLRLTAGGRTYVRNLIHVQD